MEVPLSLVPVVSEMLAERAAQVQAGNRPARSSDANIQMLEAWVPPPAGRVSLVGPVDARAALESLAARRIKAAVVHLDPWFRRKSSRGRAWFLAEALPLLNAAARVGEHVFVWGWQEAVARLIDHLPKPLVLEAWLTWYFKNAASRGKSWRPAQQACLHLKRPGAVMYPQHFYADRHREMAASNKLEFKMTPFSVIESALVAGAIKKSEQTGFKGGQKPLEVIERLMRMTTQPGDLVIDPTAGSGTTGEVAGNLGLSAMLSDRSTVALRISHHRLASLIAPK